MVTVLSITGLINACKKDDQTPLKNYLSNPAYGNWQLASLYAVHFKRNTNPVTDTLAASCGAAAQAFTFNTDGTCTYQNFQCGGATNKGSWSIQTDSLVLHANVQVKDSTARASNFLSRPFNIAQIINLGRNSLVIKTGDINSYYPDTATHTYYRYSFIHPAAQ